MTSINEPVEGRVLKHCAATVRQALGRFVKMLITFDKMFFYDCCTMCRIWFYLHRKAFYQLK